jgi:hypothetical protein
MKHGARYRIVDLRTGWRWDVEAIQPRRHHRAEFGDSLDERCDGAITEEGSRISEATHKNVRYAGNPLGVGN